MNTKLFFTGVLSIILIISLSGCTSSNDTIAPPQQGGQGNTEPPAEAKPPALPAAPEAETPVSKAYAVEITESGYVPATLTIKQGDTVTWANKTSTENWPASAMHPTHEKYPGSSITKCGTAEESGIFDACKGIPEGGSYSFTFNEKGEWGYHEHINVKMFGKIIVE